MVKLSRRDEPSAEGSIMQKEHKPATKGQVLEMIARFATQTPWEQVDSAFLQKEWVGLSPTEFAKKVLKVFSAHGSATSSIVTVDRTILPTYPEWMDEILCPEYESTGPAEFDVAKLERWVHPDQAYRTVNGTVCYDYLMGHDLLKDCLSLRDLEEIKEKGIVFFRKYFEGKAVIGWKSVMRASTGTFFAPSLFENDDQVLICWNWLDHELFVDFPAFSY